MTLSTPTPAQQQIIDKITALRKLTRETGCKSTRTQTEILEKLSAEDLTVVAVVLFGNKP